MNKLVYTLSLLAVLISCSKKEEETQEQPNKLTEEQIKLNKIKFGKVEMHVIDSKIQTGGTLHSPPQDKFSVHAPTDGFIQKINFITGQYVRQGEVLMTLNNPYFIDLQKQFLKSYYNMNTASKDFQRKKALLEADAVSQKAYEQAYAEYQVSQAEFNSLKSELSLLGFNPNNILKTNEITPVLAIASPKSGFVQVSELSPGAHISSTDELFVIVNQDKLHLEMNIPVRYASQIFEGEKVTFTIPEIPDTLRASVHAIGKITDPANNTVTVHADVENNRLPQQQYYEGRFVNAVLYGSPASVPSLPLDAVFEEDGKYFVFVKDPNGEIKREEVKTGISDNKYIEVLNFDPTKTLVVSGVYYLKDSF